MRAESFPVASGASCLESPVGVDDTDLFAIRGALDRHGNGALTSSASQGLSALQASQTPWSRRRRPCALQGAPAGRKTAALESPRHSVTARRARHCLVLASNASSGYECPKRGDSAKGDR